MHFSNLNKTNLIFTILFFFFIIQCFSIEAHAGTKTIRLSYNKNDIKFSKQSDFDIISLPEFGFIQDSLKVGEPMMPVKTIRVLLPSGTEVTNVKIISTKEKQLEGKYYIYPIQYPVINGEQPERKFVEPKKEIYTSNENYPGILAEFQSENYFREYYIAEILVYPLQYKPSKRELTLYTEISFEIEYIASAKYQLIPRLRQNEKKQNEIKEKLKLLIINPEDISLNDDLSKPTPNQKVVAKTLSITSSPSATEGQDVEYIIITNDALDSSFQRLADWKTKKGIVATIKTVSWISENYSGCDTQEKIRHFIQDAYSNWTTDYVLLGGDVDIIPGRIVNNQDYNPITDLYYSGLNGNWNSNGDDKFGDGADYYADLWVGRAPVHNTNEANLFVDKVFTYERNSLAPGLPSTAYLTKMLSMGGVVHFMGWNWYCGIYAKEKVNSYAVPTSLTNWRMYEYESNYGGYYSYDQILTRENAINRMNEGYSIINHIDHSSHSEMAMGSKTSGGNLSIYDVDNLTNGNKYSVVYSAGCSPSAFDYDCIGEHFVLKNNGGAVAFVGPSRSVNTWDGNNHDYEFFESLFINDNYHIGQTLAMTWYSNHTASRYNLLGDPEMPIWTAAPSILSVTHPTSVQNGTNNFTVTINNLPTGKNAVVCLQKGEEDYAVQTVTATGGAVNADFIITPNTTGNLNVTVTAHNFIPYEATVPVTQTSSANLYVDSYTIDDDASGESVGNGDGIIDAGETIELPVTLKNSGSLAANAVTATIAAYLRGTSTPHPYITITDASESFGNISAGGSASCSDDFGFTVSTNCPNEEVVEFKLTITDAASHTWSETFYLQVGTPDVQHTAHTVNGNLQAGATVGLVVELSNFGNSVAKGITAMLSSSDPYIESITDNSEQFGDIDPNSSKNSQEDFNFKISPSYPGLPEELDFTLTIQDEYGKVWTHNFELTKPSIPTILDFVGYETAIDVIWGPNTDSDLKGYNVYRSDDTSGTYEKVNNRLIEGTSYFQDTGLQIEKIYYYKVTAVDKSANESNMSDYLKTWTTIKYISGWPIKINGRVVCSSPTLFDVDNDGDMEIFIADEAGYVYAWHHNGDELYNIDNNPTTVSGFAYESGANFYGTPAIGDLDGDGVFEIVIASAGNNNLYCWHINDGNSDGKPDEYWNVDLGYISIGSPTLGDIDGDGKLEVVIHSCDGHVHIRNHDGTAFGSEPWADIGGSRWAFCTPALADLNSDGYLEVIIGGNDGYIHVLDYNGNDYPGWPKYIDRNNLASSPAIGDIDKDGQLEIVMLAADFGYQNDSHKVFPNTTIIYVLNSDGTEESGWVGGITISDINSEVMPSPALGNLDSDEELEIVVGIKTTVEAWNHDGTVVPGWPITGFKGSTSSPMIADIDGQAGNEIIIGSDDGNLYAWHCNGTPVDGWPCRTGDMIESSPAIEDIDGDGDYEVVVGSLDSHIYLWDTKGKFQKDWAMFHHDARNAGVYENWFGKMYIFNDITIPSGITLTIEPGAKIYFNNGKKLKVNGTLHAQGTPDNHVVFTSSASSPSPGSWYGIRFENSSSDVNCIIKYCDIEYADYGIYCLSASPKIYNNTISNNNYGVFLDGGSAQIESNYIIENNIGIAGEYTFASFNNNVIRDNISSGIFIGFGGYPVFYNNSITDNGGNGAYFHFYCSPRFGPTSGSTKGNNIIAFNASNGINAYYYCYPFLGSTDSYNQRIGGYNSIYANNDYNAYANGEVTMEAEHNWWDNLFSFYEYNGSSIDYTPYLADDPGGGSSLAKSTVLFSGSSNGDNEDYKSAGFNPKKPNPNRLSDLWLWGHDLFINDKVNDAIEVYKILINKFPDTKEAKKVLVKICQLSWSIEQDNIKNYLDLLINNKEVNYSLRNVAYELLVLDCLSKKRVDVGIEYCQTILRLYPDTKSEKFALYQMFKIYLNDLKDTVSASLYLNELKRKYNNDPLTLMASEANGEKANWLLEKRTYEPNAKSLKILLPEKFALRNNYPNPFNPRTTIAFDLPEESHVTLTIYDVMGREIVRLLNENQPAGFRHVIWDGKDKSGQTVSSGIYLYTLKTSAGFSETKKMALMR